MKSQMHLGEENKINQVFLHKHTHTHRNLMDLFFTALLTCVLLFALSFSIGAGLMTVYNWFHDK